jgi:hypothetical protein
VSAVLQESKVQDGQRGQRVPKHQPGETPSTAKHRIVMTKSVVVKGTCSQPSIPAYSAWKAVVLAHSPNLVNSSRVLKVPQGALKLGYVAPEVSCCHSRLVCLTLFAFGSFTALA